MLTPEEIIKKAKRYYPQYLYNLVAQNESFPWTVKTGKIKTTDDYEVIKNQIDLLVKNSKIKLAHSYSIVLKKHQTRKYNIQSLPDKIYFETESDYLKILGKQKESEKFKETIHLTREKSPCLDAWIQNNPVKTVKYLDCWDDILKVCLYFQDHPQPRLYIRELPIKVHTKFIETHKGILRELLDFILPETKIAHKETQFEKRFYLKYDKQLIRIRLLDKAFAQSDNNSLNDLTLPVENFYNLPVFLEKNIKSNISPFKSIIITENKINFLTIPCFEKSIAIWSGGGFNVRSLKKADWMKKLTIFYWGDLDIQGFQILSQLRGYFPRTVSVMMDKKTLGDFKEFIGPGKPTYANEQNNLNLSEKEKNLATHLVEKNIRLEQEKISHHYAMQNLAQMIHGSVFGK